MQIQGPSAVVMGFNKMLQDIGQVEAQNILITDYPHLPSGLEVPIVNMDFVIGGAGIGDLICHFPAFIYMAKHCPWVRGTIVCPDSLRDFANNIMKPFKTFTVHDSEWIKHKEGAYVCSPGIKVDGVIRQPFCNGTGGHLVAASFINFVNMFPPPAGADEYPVINFDNAYLSEAIQSFQEKKYVVFTTGAVSRAREVKGWLWSPIVHHVKRMGYVPVFLGKTEISLTTKTIFPEGCPYDEGLDLRDETSILEAAFIMKHAAATLGLDNGLIQIASCTDASIVAAYNIAEPWQRVPNRKAGKFISLSLTTEELSCANCQTNLKRYHPSHSFTTCLMGTTSCIDLIFNNNGERWKKALDQILS